MLKKIENIIGHEEETKETEETKRKQKVIIFISKL